MSVYKEVAWNGLTVSEELLRSFEQNPGGIFAIGFWKRPDEDFRYGGKSIDEIYEDFQNTAEIEMKLRRLSSYDEDFPSDPELYKAVIEEFGEDLVSRYVVNGVFLKNEAYEAADAIPQVALEYYYRAIFEYNHYESKDLRRRLEKFGIEFTVIEEGAGSGGVIAFMTEKELAEIDLSPLPYLYGMTILPGGKLLDGAKGNL